MDGLCLYIYDMRGIKCSFLLKNNNIKSIVVHLADGHAVLYFQPLSDLLCLIYISFASVGTIEHSLFLSIVQPQFPFVCVVKLGLS